MTREEAIKLLEKSTWIVGVGMSTDITHEELESAVKFAVDCLKQPQPDPETGVVPCGCGGKPTFLYSYVARDDECYLECPRCEAKSALRLGEERARDSWNTAMGWRKQNDKHED